MVKVLTFLNRKVGMPLDEFQAYWRSQHPKVVTRLPGVRRYVQSHVLPASYAKGEPVWDGIAEVWADDTDALRAMTQSPVHPELIADEARFIDRGRMGFLLTEEHVARDGAPGTDAVKGVEFFSRRPDLSIEAFQHHWRDTHAALVTKIPGVVRYVMSATRASAYAGGRIPPYDGAALMWFDSPDAVRAAGASAEYKALIADRQDFLAPGQPPFILTKEYVVVA